MTLLLTLLLKSSAFVTFAGTRSRLLQCVTYDDYRQAGDSMVPYKFSESLDGQLQWVLQLSQVQTASSLKQSDFFF